MYLGNQVATTDAAGGFSVSGLADLGGARTRFTIAADGYITRRTSCMLGGARNGVMVDLIPDGPPFLVGFFREIARNGYESSLDLYSLRPFTTPPSFFVKTRVESSGDPADVIERIRTIFANCARCRAVACRWSRSRPARTTDPPRLAGSTTRAPEGTRIRTLTR